MLKEQMTPRERILAAINHKPTDRVPTDYWGVGEITEKLFKRLGVSDMLGLSKALGIDKIFSVYAPLKPGRANVWNIETKTVPLPCGSGFYEEQIEFPIAKYETIDEIEENYEWPTVEMFDYSTIREQCEKIRGEGYAVECGYVALTYFYTVIRGIEGMLCDFAADEKLAEYILFKLNEFASGHTKKMLDAADGLAEITQVTDDFGAQNGLLMSEAMIEKYVGKYYSQNIAAARSFGARVFHHDDGAISELIPWIVGKGCEVLNPIQWHLPGWDLRKMKSDFGERLCFHGGIDNQHALPFGTSEDVKAEVRACVDALYGDGTGYILAPCHNFQAITPVENILTMYEYAREYGSR